MAINASYVSEMAAALPGQVSDTSKYNIDGACVLDGNVNVLVGVAVAVKSVEAFQGHKLIEPMGEDKTPYGVAIRSHFQTTSPNGQMIYEAGGGINVMTSGRVWMITKDEEAQTFGAPVKLDTDGKIKNAGAVVTGWTYAGGFTKWGDTYLAEVQLHQL